MTDRRVWMYRRNALGGIESNCFGSPDEVPPDSGWQDSPPVEGNVGGVVYLHTPLPDIPVKRGPGRPRKNVA